MRTDGRFSESAAQFAAGASAHWIGLERCAAMHARGYTYRRNAPPQSQRTPE